MNSERHEATLVSSETTFASQGELLAAAHRLSGCTLEEIARGLACELPAPPVRNKGFIGRIVERALGLHVSPLTAADFATLGVELKTLPVSTEWQPRESTFVCYVPLSALADSVWETSRVAHKLSRVLFVPIESDTRLTLAQRRVGRAFLWSPSPAQTALLQADYDEIVGRVAGGHLETLDARVGRALQLRPKAAHGGVRVRISDGEGAPSLAQPRAFYLRASFTTTLLHDSLTTESPAV